MEKYKNLPNHQPIDLPCEKQGNHVFFPWDSGFKLENET